MDEPRLAADDMPDEIDLSRGVRSLHYLPLDAEERALKASLESGEWKLASDQAAEKGKAVAAAKATLKKATFDA